MKDEEKMENSIEIIEDEEISEEMNTDAPLVDDLVDEDETLDKEIEKVNTFLEKEKEEKSEKMKKGRKKLFTIIKFALIGLGSIAALFMLYVVVRAFFFKKQDDVAFKMDNPDDPLSYSNVSSSIDDSVMLPVFRFSVYGSYNGIAQDDALKTYRFVFDQTGYYEGYSSVSDDDFGSWDIESDGDNYYINISCTETEDRYRVKISEEGIITLIGKDHTFTLAADSELGD